MGLISWTLSLYSFMEHVSQAPVTFFLISNFENGIPSLLRAGVYLVFFFNILTMNLKLLQL